MFIDGLDEFEGPGGTVIDMITDLADQTHVKVCVSSRPLLAFEEAFSGKPSLKLQDLTFDSIRAYAGGKLSKLIQERVSLHKIDGHLDEGLVSRIVERADGVFLWAVIAVREVREGLREIADMSELAQMIDSLPSELEKLFMLMLDRIKPAYKRDAVRFLQIVLYTGLEMYDSYSNFKSDLCTLHFSHSQRDLGDTPFAYEKIATSELVAACRILRTRLLSHTAGLLELARRDEGDRIYGKWHDLDPVLFTKINFLHRTVRDFLLNNTQAKSYLALIGSTETQVRLAIARGILTQVAHFSQGDAEVVEEWPNPVYFPFLASLQQLSLTERLGAAQAKLTGSLDFATFARGYFVPDDPRGFYGQAEAFTIENSAETSIDLVGMAAAVGMTVYVCEQLDLPIESRRYFPSLPDTSTYFRNRQPAATICWNGGNQLPNPGSILATVLRSSNYRQTLARCLRWEMEDPLRSRTAVSMKHVPSAETYMLSCCKPRCFDLTRILLRAGANPMVRVNPIPSNLDSIRWFPQQSFWHSWLYFLLNLRYRYMIANGISGGILPHSFNVDAQVTLNDVFDITKALLFHGADINYELRPARSSHVACYLKRRGMEKKRFDLRLTSSAVFTLEECFNTEPEFRECMIALKPLVTTPTRKIVGINLVNNYEFYTSGPNNDTCPSAEESEVLWPLIEKWESTGRRDDLDSLQAAMKAVFAAHNSDRDLKTWGIDSGADDAAKHANSANEG